MTTSEKTELVIIIIVTIILWFIDLSLPEEVNSGSLLLWTSVLLLIQSLIRDLWLLAKNKRRSQSSQGQKLQCMCLESTVGMTGIMIAAIVIFSGYNHIIYFENQLWSLLFALVTFIGFFIKDYIFTWNPFSIRKEKDYLNIVFRWKK